MAVAVAMPQREKICRWKLMSKRVGVRHWEMRWKIELQSLTINRQTNVICIQKAPVCHSESDDFGERNKFAVVDKSNEIFMIIFYVNRNKSFSLDLWNSRFFLLLRTEIFINLGMWSTLTHLVLSFFPFVFISLRT